MARVSIMSRVRVTARIVAGARVRIETVCGYESRVRVRVSFMVVDVYLDEVAREMSRACRMPLMYTMGLFLVMKKYMAGRMKRPCSTSPITTVIA
jgi:hypothetical protein